LKLQQIATACADFPTGVELADDTRKHPLAATKWARPVLLHAVCSERMPFVRTGGVGSAKRVLLFLVTLTLTLTSKLWRDFCTMHLTAKFHHPTFNRSEVIVLKNTVTNRRR